VFVQAVDEVTNPIEERKSGKKYDLLKEEDVEENKRKKKEEKRKKKKKKEEEDDDEDEDNVERDEKSDWDWKKFPKKLPVRVTKNVVM
tara:strand:+ start:309 stop:572 length:264 start_codon:yes stop_codon:yes gene_type:complete